MKSQPAVPRAGGLRPRRVETKKEQHITKKSYIEGARPPLITMGVPLHSSMMNLLVLTIVSSMNVMGLATDKAPSGRTLTGTLADVKHVVIFMQENRCVKRGIAITYFFY